ncbi:A/G-specific adenine glycosylase [Rhabdobacter roseus]|uniref:Adenine DNA glycosylase n=1 Tax=Rhabdobacter roseus TaxID=1655419 RepID=A0A840TS11_9BACT|nr:A/G-specific adenine glycosylase [Rhabdobacter roseus]MBB5284497.1 A/G-specific adenine glycosylase [Rhabdobacter roseus]
MSLEVEITPSEFSERIIRWYHHHHRDLPWRHTTDPYQIWLSEVILQQTRVAQGLPYYLRFVAAYPTVTDLAQADEKDVLRLWQGLGYYSRARNMHQTARQIVAEQGGTFPTTYAGLLKLKGIGTYTAGAVASFAFNEAVAAVDGNVYRVLARIFGIRTDILSTAAKKEFADLAQYLMPADDAATFNQALIEFGAIQCQPVAPDCLLCPFNTLCYAFQHGAQALLPVKAKKAKVRDRYLNYIVLEQRGKLAMRERTGKDVWQGMYDFYLVETTQEVELLDDLLPDAYLTSWAQAGKGLPVRGPYVHLLSHQRLKTRFWRFELPEQTSLPLPVGMVFYDEEEIEQLPKPVLIDAYVKEYFFS